MKRIRLQVIVLLAMVLGVSFSAYSLDFAYVNKGADITTMCGEKPMKIGLSDGFGGNIWRQTVLAEVKDEASKCPNVTEVLYTNGNGDAVKTSSDINSLVAQGVDVLIVFPDFGDAQLPALRAATRTGVTVIPYLATMGGKPGKDYAANVPEALTVMAEMWMDWLAEALPEGGNGVFLGGVPAARSSNDFLQGVKNGIKKHPKLKLLDENYIVTNWNPADAQKAVTGLIAKYPKIDWVASDYGVTTLAAIKAFKQAGLPVPAMATNASNNELNCMYLNDKKADKGWPYYTLDGTTGVSRFALRRGVAEFQGTTNNEPLWVVPFEYGNSLNGTDPKCDPLAPPDADLSTSLPKEKLDKILKQ